MKVALICIALLLVSGCDQVTRHKALSTLFDGVPKLPPVDQICADYAVESKVMPAAGMVASGGDDAPKGSSHEPYGEKDCGGCHETGASNALLLPPDQLCFKCHVGFIEGPNVHGPVAVHDCLACHLPHQSQYLSLLKKSRSDICSICHKEERLAAALHQRVDEKELLCVDCHGAHFGKNQYFLK